MHSSRLAQDPVPRSPAEMVVDAVRQHRRLDGLLDRLRLLTEVREGAEYCVERMIHAEQDRAKVTLALLNAGALGVPAVDSSSLGGAAEALGWPTVVQASIAVLFLASCREAARESGSDGMELFKRSMLCGVSSRGLGAAMGIEESESFCLGLLQDVGVIGMSAWVAGDYRRFLDSPQSPDPETERGELGIDHTQAGLALLIYRGFGARLCEAAAFHHGHPERISTSARLASAAWRLTESNGDNASLCARILGVDAQVLDQAIGAVGSARAGITRLFG